MKPNVVIAFDLLQNSRRVRRGGKTAINKVLRAEPPPPLPSMWSPPRKLPKCQIRERALTRIVTPGDKDIQPRQTGQLFCNKSNAKATFGFIHPNRSKSFAEHCSSLVFCFNYENPLCIDVANELIQFDLC